MGLPHASPEFRTTPPAGVSERENYYGVVIAEPVVQVVTNSGEVKAPHSFQSCVQRRRTHPRLSRDENEGLLQLLT
jgi:hypothetical protein